MGHNKENLEHNRVYCGEMPKSIMGKIWGIMYSVLSMASYLTRVIKLFSRTQASSPDTQLHQNKYNIVLR